MMIPSMNTTNEKLHEQNEKFEHPNVLTSALVLLKCSKNHNNDCRAIRDAMLEKFGYIQEAYTTNTEVYNQKWCVAASALIPSNEIKQFKKDLSNLDADEDGLHITLDNFRVILDEQ